jgi:hypothetical protein
MTDLSRRSPANGVSATDWAAAKEAAADGIEYSLFEVFCLANALAAAPVGLDRIGIDEKDREEILTYLADRVRFTAKKALDLWVDPTEAKRHVCAKWPHCV